MPPAERSDSEVARTFKNVVLVGISLLLVGSLILVLARPEYAQPLYVHATYWLLMVTVVTWLFTYFTLARDVTTGAVVAWLKDNKAGLALAVAVTIIAGLAIEPALRLLSDEAGLVGTSRNFFFKKAATYTTSGKYYYDQFWETSAAIDQRPPLFPFLVGLVHVVRGYSFANVFTFNLLALPVFVLLVYRIAKTLGGEIFGVVAGILVVAQPITLIAARSGGFDFFATLFALLIAHSFLAHCRRPSAETLAVLWMNLCLFAEIRYESALFLPVVIGALLVFRLAKWSYVKRYAAVYALTPAYLLPRAWQALLLGSVPEQLPGTVTFSLQNFLTNFGDYFKPVFAPFDFYLPHAAAVIALGTVGSVLAARWCVSRARAKAWREPEIRFGVMVAVFMAAQLFIVFTYVWGRAQHPAAARLVIAIDTFLAFPAAWILLKVLGRFRPFVAVVVAVALFAVYLPVASEHRLVKTMTLTREAGTAWRYFASLHQKRILIVAERPALYTIMEYGAVDYDAARRDPRLLEALSRGLFYDVYLVQDVNLNTKQPLPKQDVWPERPRQTVLEFQNDAHVLVRISRLSHEQAK